MVTVKDSAQWTINRVQGPCEEWDKIFIKSVSDKSLVSRIYKKTKYLVVRKIIQLKMNNRPFKSTIFWRRPYKYWAVRE